MAKKGTKAYSQEYVRIHYGIDYNTMEVESVWERRDGMLEGKGIHHHPAGRTATNELVVVFGLRDIQTLPITVDSRKTRENLEEKAAELREQRAAKDGKDG